MRYKAEKQLYILENSSSPFSNQNLYWALINFKTEYILYMMALAKDEEIKKAISNFYTHQRNIKPYIKGRDLLKIGIPPSPIFSTILNQVLNAKLDGQLKTKKEEINFAKEYAKKNNFID
jgi:tRNA nucleotidyltransferase (CCA-adding enzyme)